MNADKKLTLIGRAEELFFTEVHLQAVMARIDTGAKTSSIWASRIREADGMLFFTLLDTNCDGYTGHELHTKQYTQRMVASSNGSVEERYVVRLLVTISGRKIRASFTLADRSTQVYPALVGRNVLRGKFIVDVRNGQPLTHLEKSRSAQLQSGTRKEQKG